MTSDEVKEVVKTTINELLKERMIKYNDNIIYDKMSEMLRAYYNKPYESMTLALSQLVADPYYELLEMYYRDNLTLEQIAECKYLDISTVVRNKKRLCIKLFEVLESL